MIFRFSERMKDLDLIKDEYERKEGLEKHDRELEDFISDKVGGWSDWIPWMTPRIGIWDADLTDILEPDLLPGAVVQRWGRKRTNGPEVEFDASVVYGADGNQPFSPAPTSPLASPDANLVWLELPEPSDLAPAFGTVSGGSYEMGRYQPFNGSAYAEQYSMSFTDNPSTVNLIAPPREVIDPEWNVAMRKFAVAGIDGYVGDFWRWDVNSLWATWASAYPTGVAWRGRYFRA